MTWTYTDADPAASDLNWVRFKIGDTLEKDPQLQDAEIQAMLDESSHRLLAALACARALQAKFSRLVDTTRADASDALSAKAKAYAELEETLLDEIKETLPGALTKSGPAVATGQSQAGKRANEADADLVKPWAYRDVTSARRDGS